jgi:hypothetical protein
LKGELKNRKAALKILIAEIKILKGAIKMEKAEMNFY